MVKNEPKMPTERQLRVGEEVRHVLSDVLLRQDLYDADLAGALVMITEVKMSPDFSWATAYVHAVGGQPVQTVIDALNRNKGIFRKAVGQKIRLRITPDIRFREDNSFDEAVKIETLLNDPKVKADINKED